MIFLLRRNFIIPLCYIVLYTFSNYLICYYLPLQIVSISEVFSLIKQGRNFSSVLNEPLFWNSSVGLFIRLLVEIIISGLVLFIGFIMCKIPVKAKKCFTIIALAHSVFLLSIWIEFIFLKTAFSGLKNDYFTKFPLFSLGYFFNIYDAHFSSAFSYFFQRLVLQKKFILLCEITKIVLLYFKNCKTKRITSLLYLILKKFFSKVLSSSK